eukprot:1194667-Prorocentrum_minimum.AAC.2
MLYLYQGEWIPRVWDMSEVYNPMYPTAPRSKFKGALKCFFGRVGFTEVWGASLPLLAQQDP